MSEENPSSASLAQMAMLGEMWDEYRPRLLAMLERRLDPAIAARISADEVLQEAFLLARRKWPTCAEDAKQNPFAWWYRVARDCLIEAWRRETRPGRDPRKEMPWPQESSVQLGLSLMDHGTGPSKAAARDELRVRMRQTLDLLKQADRDILWMRHYDQLSFKEAAQVLDLTETAATVRYVRAVKRLKKLWLELYPREESRP